MKLYATENQATAAPSHSVRSVWIEMMFASKPNKYEGSHSVRSVWIEIGKITSNLLLGIVTLRKECVD